MMRPKAALYYLKEINSVMDAFQTHIESGKLQKKRVLF